jgi:carbamoyl-phosphate synthase large subunit
LSVSTTNVFVTGAGALVGQGVLRLLRMMKRQVRIVTGDPDPRAAGHWLGDKAFVIPMARDPNYVAELARIVRDEKISVLFVGTDVELSLFAKEKERFAALGTRVVVSSPQVVEIADDKWLTVQFLRENGFPFPQTALASEPAACRQLAAECGLPLFAKPRRGARSVGARSIRTAAELEAAIAPGSDLVIQEYLPEQPGEFTAGCVGASGRISGVVVLRRDLRDGNTFRAYHDGTSRYEARIAEIATKLGVEGPSNFQFRVKQGEPVVFEINARFSGTTPLRAMFGFNEVEAIVENLLTGAPIEQPVLRAGTVLRVWSDIIVAPAQLEVFTASGELDKPAAEAMPFITPRRS